MTAYFKYIADRSCKKLRIFVGTVHVYRLIPSVSIPFDEKLGNSCMNGTIESKSAVDVDDMPPPARGCSSEERAGVIGISCLFAV